MKMEYCVISDIGRRRENNEDNFYVNGMMRERTEVNHVEYDDCVEQDELLCAVFDGMGGEEYGELASLEAAKILGRYRNTDFQTLCEQYVDEANKSICDMMCTLHGGRMGSTLAVAYIKAGKLNICNLGDSPVYLLRNGVLQQISVNHNEAQSLYDMGIITREQMRTCRQKNQLTQHLGIYEDELVIEPYCNGNIALQKDDYIMLCSDGLTDMIEDKELENICIEGSSVQMTTAHMIQTALEHGGKDNITVLLVHMLAVS